MAETLIALTSNAVSSQKYDNLHADVAVVRHTKSYYFSDIKEIDQLLQPIPGFLQNLYFDSFGQQKFELSFVCFLLSSIATPTNLWQEERGRTVTTLMCLQLNYVSAPTI
jgi:hypothetical protein